MKYFLITLLLSIEPLPISAQTITLAPIEKTAYCADDTIFVNFTITGTFDPKNVFYLQLSDSTGNFADSTGYGSYSVDNQPIKIRLLLPGSAYRVRVASTNPVVVSADNGQNIQVLQYPIPSAKLLIGIHGLAANATDSTSGPAVVIGQQVIMLASARPAADTFHWSFNDDASISSASGDTARLIYPTAGLKTGILTGVNRLGCGNSIPFAFRVLDCHPTIPRNASIVTGFENVADTFIWIKPGAVDTLPIVSYPQTIFVDDSAGVFGLSDFTWNTYYLKAGSSINHIPENGTVIWNQGFRDTFEASAHLDSLSCDNLDFDYSLVASSVVQEKTPTTLCWQEGDRLFAQSDGETIEMRVNNILGEEILVQRGIGTLDIDLSAIRAGIYFVVIESDGHQREMKQISMVH